MESFFSTHLHNEFISRLSVPSISVGHVSLAGKVESYKNTPQLSPGTISLTAVVKSRGHKKDPVVLRHVISSSS